MDKQLTRWKRQGATRVLLFGRWWDLDKGPSRPRVRVDYRRRQVVVF